MIDKQRIKQRMQYIRPLFVPMILYIGLLIISFTWAPKIETTVWQYVVTLLPIVPGLFIAIGLVRVISMLDDLERRIILEAFAFSFAVTLIFLLGFSLLQLVGVSQPSLASIIIIMGVFLVIGKLWGNWRYR